jgi:type III restriction enzyme
MDRLGRGAGGEGNSLGDTIQYEGRHLFTGEVIQKLQLNLPLLESGIGAVSYYVKQLETICKLRGLHGILAPLIQTFLESILFEQKSSLFDPALVTRLADSDVGEHLRAVFVPLIRSRTTATETRLAGSAPKSLNTWKPYQVTLSERRPALEASKALFNLVTCNRELEVAVAKFCDRAPDVAAFAKNAGSQCLRVDYLANGDRLAFYTPDFFIRTINHHYYLVETKGREDRDVPLKAKMYLPSGITNRWSRPSRVICERHKLSAVAYPQSLQSITLCACSIVFQVCCSYSVGTLHGKL